VDFRCPDDIFLSPDRRSLIVRTGSGYVQTVRINLLDARDLSAWFGGSVRPDGINSPLDGEPTEVYIPWSSPIHSTPPKSSFLAFCALFSLSFWLYIASF